MILIFVGNEMVKMLILLYLIASAACSLGYALNGESKNISHIPAISVLLAYIVALQLKINGDNMQNIVIRSHDIEL